MTAEEEHQKYLDELKKCGMTPDTITQLINSVPRDKNGNYIFKVTAPYGSIMNPVIVGIPECSDTLVFDWHKNRWILTDGLGNGWIR